MNREESMALLQEWTQNPNLIKHALAVEASMRAYARRFGEDEEKWGITGLLHDFDYERYPSLEDHPLKGSVVLEQKGYPEEMIYAIKAHNTHLGLPRTSLLDKSLFAVDELCGFVIAVALVKPSKSLSEVDARSVRKKMKDKAFARSVNREDIHLGIQELGMDADEHIEFVVDALTRIEADLGLGAHFTPSS